MTARPSPQNVDRPAATDAGAPALQAYFVTGFDANTRQDVCYTVHANDPDHARQLATGSGVQVQQVESAGAVA